jgi:hypothetical protein
MRFALPRCHLGLGEELEAAAAVGGISGNCMVAILLAAWTCDPIA